MPDLPARVRMFVDAYGLTDRMAILPALRQCKPDEPEPLRSYLQASIHIIQDHLQGTGCVIAERVT